jgi:hypothetical protein
MSPLSQLARAILILHGLMNIAQGAYSFVSPQEYAVRTGNMFKGAPDKAIQSIGI